VAQVIPLACARYPNVHFIIGGDGNKKLLVEEMRVRDPSPANPCY
jgi:phosphatidylinositol N-acetylglucosaminyltransferase subunit A